MKVKMRHESVTIGLWCAVFAEEQSDVFVYISRLPVLLVQVRNARHTLFDSLAERVLSGA